MTKLLGRLPAGLLLVALTACGGGGGGGGASTPGAAQQVSGTLTIITDTVPQSLAVKKPQYVSAGTTHAYVFINNSATPNGSSTSCSGTNGTGTACTINWTAAVAVPGSYTFQVETDNGTSVLSEGEATEALVAGNNTLATLSLNGVAAEYNVVTQSCTAGTPGTCSGYVNLLDAAGDWISYAGTTAPGSGTSPTNGTAFDNGGAGITATANGTACPGGVSCGKFTGSAQSLNGSSISSVAGGVLTLLFAPGTSVGQTNSFTFTVSCLNGTATGSFGVTFGATSASGVGITAGQLSNESPVPAYPASIALAAGETAPSYTCSNGAIASATGTLPVN